MFHIRDQEIKGKIKATELDPTVDVMDAQGRELWVSRKIQEFQRDKIYDLETWKGYSL